MTGDPCKLLTQEEASTLVGAAVGPGKVVPVADGITVCVYQKDHTYVSAALGKGSSAAQVNQLWEKALAEFKSGGAIEGTKVTEVPGIGDRAVNISADHFGSVNGISVSSALAVRGSDLVGVSTLATRGGKLPSADTIDGQLRVLLDRL